MDAIKCDRCGKYQDSKGAQVSGAGLYEVLETDPNPSKLDLCYDCIMLYNAMLKEWIKNGQNETKEAR